MKKSIPESNDNELILPFYAKVTIFLVGIFALVTALYITQDIVVPLIFALIIAIVLHPVVNFFVRKGINRILAIVITLFLTFFVIAAFCLLLFSQVSKLSESWPTLVDKFTEMVNQSITWVSQQFDINAWKIHQWVKKNQKELISINSAEIGQTLVTVGNAIMVLLLIPVYVFIILFYQPLLIEFIRRLFKSSFQSHVGEIIKQTKTVIQRYLIGLIIEAVLVAILNTAVLFIFGIEYAILLGILGALLNVIPYIGGIVGVALPMMVALATKESGWFAIYILIAYMFIQLIDNNYIVPKIVASKVKINALFSIIVVFAGNQLWGISGMFLSIPLLGIIKLIFDHIEPLKPWGFLLGDTMPSLLNLKKVKRIRFKKDTDL